MGTAMAPDARAVDSRRDARPSSGLRHWPLTRHSWEQAGWAWIFLTAILLGIGLFIVHVLEDGAFGRFDVRVSEWFRDQRTPQREDLAQIGSGLSDTLTVIPLCAVLVGLFAWRFRRWNESILVVGALLYEKAIFLPVTMIVDRDRPPIGQLDGNPPSSSFFSGHVAAAVALYFGLWMVVRWHSDSRALRAIATIVASLAVIAVALSRMLLGMHYLSDVVIGAIVGALSLMVVDRGLRIGEREHRRRQSSESASPTAISTP
jgi:membrane-associated phospholipid phosphatase